MEFVPCSQCPELAPKGQMKCPACGAPLLAEAPDGAHAPPPLQPALSPEVQSQARSLEEEIKAKPTAKALYLKLAEVYEGAGRRDLATATLNRLLEIEPGNTYVKHRLSLLERPPSEASRTAAAMTIPRMTPRPAPPPRFRWSGVVAGVALLAVLAVVTKWFFFPQTKRIVTLAEGARTPQWSPTGERIAFVSDRKDGSSLCVYDIAKRAVREVGSIVGGGNESFAWAPDGQRLAYVGPDQQSAWGDAVFVANVQGAAAANRLGTGSAPQWSPDGSWVAFSCSAPEAEATDDGEITAAWRTTSYVCLASLTGSSPRQIPLPAPVRSLAFSPDGSRLALALEASFEESAPAAETAPEHPDGELVALADGAIAGRPTNVLEGSRGLQRELEARAYDKRKGARSPGVPVAMTDLFVVGIDGSGLVQLTSDHRAALRTWGNDGRIVFIGTLTAGEGAELISMTSDGSDRQSLFKMPLEADDASAVVPNRDLSRVIFPARVKEANEMVANLVTGESAVDLFVVEKGRSGVRRLANKHPFKQRYALSPDGRKIVYEVRDPKSGRSELWLMRL
jgi:Tol biopolymer transport system component